ncbi:YHYH protein [Vibrio sonorensis]|uniref:YHYH protein n=1 Tax=Vibrio sonorensis TaxID=1004316 RepID=UPI0008DB25CD|nr:YHYH protein [Vibrio sonorensis]
MNKDKQLVANHQILLGLIAVVLLVGCNASGGDGESTGNASSTNSTNLTNVLLSNTNADCRQYVGDFFSSVTDVKRSLPFTGQVNFSSSGTKCIIQSNAIPNHDFNDGSANFATDVSEQSLDYQMTATPVLSGFTDLSLGTSEAILLNGVKVDLLAAACYGVGSEPLGQEKIGCGQNQIGNPWRYDPMSPLNNFGTDTHNAHVQPTGEYHYHGNPVALFEQECVGKSASPVIGFAADGYPVYGSCFFDSSTGNVRKAVSSYRLKSGTRQAEAGYTTPVAGNGVVASNSYDGQFRGDWEYVVALGDLDQCNGMTVNGQYGYYVTDSFPWMINCFRGSADASFSGAISVRSHSHD